MRRALIFRTGALGDTILATGVALSLKQYYPEAHIDFLVSKGAEGLFSLIPWIDQTYVVRFRKIPWEFDPWKRRLLTALNLQGYDLAVLLETHRHFVRFFSKIKTAQRLSVPVDTIPREGLSNVHTVVRYQQLLWDAGIVPKEVFPPKILVPHLEKERSLELLRGLGLDEKRPIVGLHPGNSFRQRKKVRRWIRSADMRSWPEARWCGLVHVLQEAYPGIQFVLFGSKWDRKVNDRILESVRNKDWRIQAASSAGMTDLALAAALMQRFDVFVSTDSGPIHMAAALGTPIVGLYGPTRYEETKPFCEESLVKVLKKDLQCQPCYGTPLQKQCKDALCMKAIEVSQVAEAVKQLGVLSHRSTIREEGTL